MVQAAACIDGGLAALLSADEAKAVQPWQQDFVRSSLSTLAQLNIGCQLQKALQQLQHSKSHRECHAILGNIKLLCCVDQV